MRKKRKPKQHRINLRMSDPEFQRLQSLMQKTENDATAVIRRSLRIYEELLARQNTDGAIFRRDENGDEIELLFVS